MRDSLVGDGSLFQPDVLLPAQCGMRARRLVLDPSQRLVVAIFEDAVECFQKHWAAKDPKINALHHNAREWIWSEEKEWPYSFLNACDLLGLNAEYVRRGLDEWLEKQKPKLRHATVVPLKKRTEKVPEHRHVLSRAS